MLKTNYIEWKQNIKTNPDWKPPIDQEFIPHILPILAAIPLVKNESGKICPKLTYQHIPDIIKTPNGTIPGDQVKALLGFTAIIRRSVLLPKTTQTKHPQYGIYTPLAMYAHKLYNNIGYERWSQEINPYLTAFLGTTLFNAFKVAKTNGKPDLANIVALRKEALTYKSGAKSGTMDKITAHRCNVISLDVKSRDGSIEKKKYTKYAVMAFLQLWICNVSLRDTEAMLLDLYNWGNVPDALDSCKTTFVPDALQAEKSDLEDLWSIL